MTLEKVLIEMLMAGADRAALVQRKTEKQKIGVLVMLASAVAVRRIGPPLIELMREMGDSEKRQIGELSEQSEVASIFEMNEQSRHGWAWFELRFGRTDIVCAVFRGEDVCKKVAAICTAHGAPCSLDPDRPADDWQIACTVRRS